MVLVKNLISQSWLEAQEKQWLFLFLTKPNNMCKTESKLQSLLSVFCTSPYDFCSVPGLEKTLPENGILATITFPTKHVWKSKLAVCIRVFRFTKMSFYFMKGQRIVTQQMHLWLHKITVIVKTVWSSVCHQWSNCIKCWLMTVNSILEPVLFQALGASW